MNRIIVADNQAIFRAGAARVLALEDDMRIVAQCDDLTRLLNALEAHRGVILLLAASLQFDIDLIVARVRTSGSRVVLIGENGAEIPDAVARAIDGIVFRNVPAPD